MYSFVEPVVLWYIGIGAKGTLTNGNTTEYTVKGLQH